MILWTRIDELFLCRVLKKVKDYTLFPLVWLNEVKEISKTYFEVCGCTLTKSEGDVNQ